MPDYNTPAINTLIVKSLPVDADAMLLEDSANLWQKKKVLISSLILNNVLRGILGVASGWGTDPANLENMTDGDIDTVTGTGEKVMGGAGSYGYLTFDLGSIKTVLIGCRVGLWSSAGTAYFYPQESNDLATWRMLTTNVANITSATEKVVPVLSPVLNGRYIRFQFYVNTAATAYAKIYEVAAWELKL